MAIDDSVQLSHDTDNLVLPNKAFYPLKIPVQHWQLRHFISSPEPDIIYYADGHEVYCLNVATRARSHVTALPFEARCTASGYGWICVGGGDRGHFATIKVGDSSALTAADVDALLPLDLGIHPLGRPASRTVTPRVKIEKVGDEIVNSISIHRLLGDNGQTEDDVAVCTNNDRTVRIYSLTREEELTVLELPFPMNHATISPDGQLLIAVGDYHQAYFYERVKSKSVKSKLSNSTPQSASSEWEILNIVQLHAPPTAMLAAYFTTAWSPSGSLCAVASEAGYISIFDADLIRTSEWGDDAVVQIVPSSRPDDVAGPGSVRTMCFAPQPWDLLIWSESQGRICVADLRAGLLRRQVLELNPQEDGLHKYDIVDCLGDINPELRELSQEAEFIRRYRRAFDPEGNTSAIDITTDYLEVAAERRRIQRLAGITTSEDDDRGLTPQERQILEALRTTRQREEARDRSIAPQSINYRSTALDENDSRRSLYVPSRAFPTLGDEGSGVGTALPALGSLRDFLRERSQDPDRSSYQPRRQASVVLSNNNNNSNNNATSSTSHPSPRTTAVIPPHARRIDSPSISANDPWRTIEAAMVRASPSAHDSNQEPSAELRRRRQLLRARERARSLREAQLSSQEMAMLRRTGYRARADPECGVSTTGLAMSRDGRKLFVGCEEGIFEFQINVQERKSFPAVQTR